jgi:hypothetical protein
MFSQFSWKKKKPAEREKPRRYEKLSLKETSKIFISSSKVRSDRNGERNERTENQKQGKINFKLNSRF